MQTRSHPALRQRGLFYWGRLYTGQLLRGSPYPELRRCVVIFITAFVELAGERFHSVFQALERQGHEPLTDHFELHFVELPKLTALRAVAEVVAVDQRTVQLGGFVGRVDGDWRILFASDM